MRATFIFSSTTMITGKYEYNICHYECTYVYNYDYSYYFDVKLPRVQKSKMSATILHL